MDDALGAEGRPQSAKLEMRRSEPCYGPLYLHSVPITIVSTSGIFMWTFPPV